MINYQKEMIKALIITLIIACMASERGNAQYVTDPDTVYIPSGKLVLKGLLWHPSGHGPFRSVIFCQGSYESNDIKHNPIQEASLLGPVFARKGYIFLTVFRRGVGLSNRQGPNSADLIRSAFKEKGQEERNNLQLEHLETDQLQDMISGIKFMRERKDINRIAVIGHSFGGSLSLLLAESDPSLRPIIVFAAAGYSWDKSPQLRSRLISAVKKINAPVLIIHARNDYSINPGKAIDSVMTKLHKPHLLRIYPNFGTSADEGHNFIFLNIESWEPDVFDFLDKNMQY
jgi:dienelactone hydrolase